MYYFVEGAHAVSWGPQGTGRWVTLVWHRWKKCIEEVDSLPCWYFDCLTLEEVDEYMSSFFDRAKKREESQGTASPLRDEQALKRFPTLLEVLGARMESAWGDTNRCSMSVWLQDGRWRVILKDKSDGTALWLTTDTLNKVFEGLEAALNDPNTIWRNDRFANNGEANRRKKK